MSEPTEITLPDEDIDPFEVAFKEFSMSEDAAPADPKPVVETPPAEPEAPALPVEDKDADAALLARLAALVNQAKPEAPESASLPATPAEPAPLFNKEETAFLEEYEKEWTDVSKAEALKRRAEYHDLVRYVFNEVAEVFRPVQQNMQTLLQRAQLAELRTKVPEYDTVQAGIAAWAEKQPAYLRTAYQHVIQEGTAEDIADLVARYTKETGAVPAPTPQPKPVTELPPSAKQAAATLAPVSSRRSSTAAGDLDKGDFDAAFDRFAAGA